MYQSVTVFCGSKFGNDPLYVEHAKDLGKMLAKNNITLIYGGGNNGLMGAVANAVLENGGKVTGVIPEMLISREVQHENLTALHIVRDMHERKKLLFSLAEAAIILPGGNGTLDEMFEIMTWNQLTIHNKKIILLNTAGYYNNLIAHLVQMQKEGFLYENWQSMVSIYNTPDAVIDGLVSGKS